MMKTNFNELMKTTVIQASIKKMTEKPLKLEELKKFYGMSSHKFSPLIGVLMYDDNNLLLNVNEELYTIGYDSLENVEFSVDYRQTTVTNLPAMSPYVRLSLKIKDRGSIIINTDSYKEVSNLFEVFDSHNINIEDPYSLFLNQNSLDEFLNSNHESFVSEHGLKYPNRNIRF